MVTISLRFEDQTKAELDEMCEEMGMNLTTLFTIYAKKVLRDRRIPFSIEAPIDPFYSSSNLAQIAKADQQVKDGRVVVKTMDELEAMTGE